jgi:hypothetical protein
MRTLTEYVGSGESEGHPGPHIEVPLIPHSLRGGQSAHSVTQ